MVRKADRDFIQLALFLAALDMVSLSFMFLVDTSCAGLSLRDPEG